MSVFTDLDTLRNHLQAFDFDAIEVQTQPVILSGTDPVQLPHNGLAEGSVNVFTLEENEPAGPVELTLNGESWVATGHESALPDSFAVSGDDLPRERFLEGLDYAVNDDTAEVKRLDGGSIGDGATVYVWLLPLTAAELDVDYELDLDQGTIKRLATGSLPDPVRVYVRYRTTPARASEALLTQAIDDAEGRILARLKPDYDESSTDYGLTLGATELALSFVCDDLAGGVLARNGDPTSDDRAKLYLELSRRYELRAFHSLTPFLRMPPPAASAKQANTPAVSW